MSLFIKPLLKRPPDRPLEDLGAEFRLRIERHRRVTFFPDANSIAIKETNLCFDDDIRRNSLPQRFKEDHQVKLQLIPKKAFYQRINTVGTTVVDANDDRKRQWCRYLCQEFPQIHWGCDFLCTGRITANTTQVEFQRIFPRLSLDLFRGRAIHWDFVGFWITTDRSTETLSAKSGKWNAFRFISHLGRVTHSYPIYGDPFYDPNGPQRLYLEATQRCVSAPDSLYDAAARAVVRAMHPRFHRKHLAVPDEVFRTLWRIFSKQRKTPFLVDSLKAKSAS